MRSRRLATANSSLQHYHLLTSRPINPLVEHQIMISRRPPKIFFPVEILLTSIPLFKATKILINFSNRTQILFNLHLQTISHSTKLTHQHLRPLIVHSITGLLIQPRILPLLGQIQVDIYNPHLTVTSGVLLQTTKHWETELSNPISKDSRTSAITVTSFEPLQAL